VACAYVWNADTFSRTFASEVLIFIALQILSSCFKRGKPNEYRTKLDIEDKRLLGPTELYSTLFMISFLIQAILNSSFIGLIYQFLILVFYFALGFAHSKKLINLLVDICCTLCLMISTVQICL